MSVRILTKGAKEYLMNRIQCMREVGFQFADKLDYLEQRRADCCGYSLSSSSSSLSSSSGDQPFNAILAEDLFYVLDEENNYILEEDQP